MDKTIKIKIKKGDKVRILLGKDRNKEGVIERVSREGLVWVGGLNIYKRHVKKNNQLNIEGGVIEIVKPLDVSNVALVCPHCGKITRISHKSVGGEKLRMCKKCKKAIGGKA